MKRKFKGIVFLQPLSKPNNQTKICSIKDVCKGIPLPNNRTNFYPGSSACIPCVAAKSKRKWAERQKDTFM